MIFGLRLIRIKFRWGFAHISSAKSEPTTFLLLERFLTGLWLGEGLLPGLWCFIAGQRAHCWRQSVQFS